MNKEEMEDPKWEALGQVIGDYLKEEIEKPSQRDIKLKCLQYLTDFYKALNKKDEKMAKEKLINYRKQINLLRSEKLNKDV